MYLIIDQADGFIECNSIGCNSIEEENGNKYLIFVSKDKNKGALEEYTKLWDEIKYQIKTIKGGE